MLLLEYGWGMLALFVLGVSTLFSPCSGPLLFSVLPFIVRSRRGEVGSLLCFLAVFAVFFGVGTLVVMAGGLLDLIYALRYLVGLGLIVLGVGMFLGVKMRRPLLSRPIGSRGVITICATYALFSSQCNLPLIAGAALFIMSGVGSYDRLAGLITYALGVSLPLLLILVMSDRFRRLQKVERGVAKASVLLERISGLILMVGGVLLILS